MKIYDYCLKYKDNFAKYDQTGFFWENRFKRLPYLEIESFSSVISDNSIPSEIKRDYVLKAFQDNDLYKGYIFAMLWGGINTQPAKGYSGDSRTSSAYKAFNISEKVVIDTLSSVKTELENGNFEKAYRILNETNKFSGVNVSFFTKLLFFISETIPSEFKLLIYDKWTKVIHLKLLIENEESEKIKEYFGENYRNRFFENTKIKTNLVYCKSENEIEAYLDYCEKMNQLSKDLSVVLNSEISPGQLEGFVFGFPLRGERNKTIENPRFWIRSTFNKLNND
jgi:hypothetical protein